MKFNLRLTTFKAKLISLMIGVTFISLLVASSGLAIIQIKNFRNSLEQSTISNAAILAFNLAPALVFDDKDSAKQLLSSFKTSPHVNTANVYKINDQNELTLITRFPEGTFDAPATNIRDYLTPYFNGRAHQLTYPIELDGDVIGYIYIQSTFSQIDEFKSEMTKTFIITMLVCLLLALVISLKFQRILLRPLSNLVALTEKISRNKDYSLRVENTSGDEFSHLAHSFNHMLEKIQKRDHRQKEVEDEIRQLNLHLEDKVHERSIELEKANESLLGTLDELNRSQKQLVEREKMASLGGLVAGIAHEVNTPIGIGVTAVSHLGELLRQLESRYDTNNIRKTDMTQFFENANEGVSITSRNLARAADLVQSFKQVAVDQSSDNVRSFAIKEYFHEILMSLRPQLKKVAHKIDLECEDNLIVRCNPGAVSQILTNLIMNSLIHGFEGIEQGSMSIVIKKTDQHVCITYADDGVGMAPEALERIFEPFYTTRRGQGGSGLGTHLVYNLVTQSLHGSISARSALGEGLKFEINFTEAVQA